MKNKFFVIALVVMCIVNALPYLFQWLFVDSLRVSFVGVYDTEGRPLNDSAAKLEQLVQDGLRNILGIKKIPESSNPEDVLLVLNVQNENTKCRVQLTQIDCSFYTSDGQKLGRGFCVFNPQCDLAPGREKKLYLRVEFEPEVWEFLKYNQVESVITRGRVGILLGSREVCLNFKRLVPRLT